MTEQKVAVWRDLFIAALVAAATIGLWMTVFAIYGDSAKLDTGLVTFLGAVLAISGLLFRQYLLKEVLDYLKSWDRMSNLLSEIVQMSMKQGRADDLHVTQLLQQKQQAELYSRYVRLELGLVPVVPLILIFLYGCALLSEKSLSLRILFLFLMIFGVAYLAIASLSSTRLACAQPDLMETIVELEGLRTELEPSIDRPLRENAERPSDSSERMSDGGGTKATY